MKKIIILAVLAMIFASCEEEHGIPYKNYPEEIWIATRSNNFGLDSAIFFLGKSTGLNTITLRDMNGVVMTGVQVTTDWQEPVAGRIKKCHTLIFYKGQELYIIPADASFISVPDAKTFGDFHQMVGIYYDDRSNVIFEASRRRGNMSGSIQLDSLACGKGPTNFGPDNFERALPGQDPKNPNCALARVEKRGGQFFLINAYGEKRIRRIM